VRSRRYCLLASKSKSGGIGLKICRGLRRLMIECSRDRYRSVSITDIWSKLAPGGYLSELYLRGTRLEFRGWHSPFRLRFTLSWGFSNLPDRLWGPPSLVSNGCRGAISPGVKRPGAWSLPPTLSNVEVKKGGAIPPLPIRFRGIVLN
jgi:hypothetical protein